MRGTGEFREERTGCGRRRELFEVAADGELLTVSEQDHRSDVGQRTDLGDDVPQLSRHRQADRVAHGRPGQADQRDAVGRFEGDWCSHIGVLTGPCRGR